MSEKTKGTICPEGIRINKYLGEAGVCSRREADRMIEEGRVLVEGKRAVAGDRILPGQCVTVDGRPVKSQEPKVLLLFYKPVGIVCSTKKQGEAQTVTEFLRYPVRVYYAGRLDKDSEGLLLLTNQGDLADQIMRSRNLHEKEYLVEVDKKINTNFVQRMSQGVPILDTVTRPCKVQITGERSFRIILTQGLNRQIRRMCEALGYQVRSLKRVRIMNLRLDGLKPGEYREIREEELNVLLRDLEGQSGENIVKNNTRNKKKYEAKKKAGNTVKSRNHRRT